MDDESLLVRAYSTVKYNVRIARDSLRTSLVLRVRDSDVTFDVGNPISHDWFLPRYGYGRIHEPQVVELLADELGSETVFFDIGANVGYYTVVAAVLDAPERIHGFEMDPRLIGEIYDSLESNGLSGPSLMTVAVSDQRRETISFEPHQRHNPSTNVLTGTENENSTRAGVRMAVPSITLDGYCDAVSVRPDVLKIDVEGHESKVLHGAEAVINAKKPSLFLEVHPKLFDNPDRELNDIASFLSDHGYEVQKIPDHRNGGDKLTSISTDEIRQLGDNQMLYCTL